MSIFVNVSHNILLHHVTFLMSHITFMVLFGREEACYFAEISYSWTPKHSIKYSTYNS